MPRTVLVIVVAVLALGGTAALGGAPTLRFADPAPADFRAVVRAAWDETVVAFPARRSCLGDVTVRGAWTLDDHARYLPASARVVVRMPATAGQLTNTLVHEFGHHLEFTCPDHAEIRRSFRLAQGLAADSPWTEGTAWEHVPSEQWAEAVVAHVLGPRLRHTQLSVTPQALEIVDAWASGD